MKTPIILVEDEPWMLTFLRVHLDFSGTMTVARVCRTAEDALRTLRGMTPTVVLLDTSLPDLPTYECVRRLRSQQHPVILLANEVRERDLFGGLRAGANGFLLKSAERAVFAEAVNRVLAGRPAFCPEALVVLAKTCVPPAFKAREGGVLKPADGELLELVAAGRTNAEIAAAMNKSVSGVKRHLERLFKRFNFHSRTEGAIFWQNLKAGSALAPASPRPGVVGEPSAPVPECSSDLAQPFGQS